MTFMIQTIVGLITGIILSKAIIKQTTNLPNTKMKKDYKPIIKSSIYSIIIVLIIQYIMTSIARNNSFHQYAMKYGNVINKGFNLSDINNSALYAIATIFIVIILIYMQETYNNVQQKNEPYQIKNNLITYKLGSFIAILMIGFIITQTICITHYKDVVAKETIETFKPYQKQYDKFIKENQDYFMFGVQGVKLNHDNTTINNTQVATVKINQYSPFIITKNSVQYKPKTVDEKIDYELYRQIKDSPYQIDYSTLKKQNKQTYQALTKNNDLVTISVDKFNKITITKN